MTVDKLGTDFLWPAIGIAGSKLFAVIPRPSLTPVWKQVESLIEQQQAFDAARHSMVPLASRITLGLGLPIGLILILLCACHRNRRPVAVRHVLVDPTSAAPNIQRQWSLSFGSDRQTYLVQTTQDGIRLERRETCL